VCDESVSRKVGHSEDATPAETMVASATAGTSSPAGLFATIEQAVCFNPPRPSRRSRSESRRTSFSDPSGQDGYLQFHSVLRGGQLLSKVHPGDILLAIDHVPCRDYSVTDIQRLIVGPEGSQVSRKEEGRKHAQLATRRTYPVWFGVTGTAALLD
jgi:hypothetical protein